MMGMKKEQSRRKRRGFVLPLTVVMIVLLTVMGLSLQRLGSGARMQAARTTAEISARAAADAGFTKAIYEMNKNLNVKPWNFSNVTDAANMELTNANADYTYTIEEIAVDTEYRITSTGQSGWAKKTVSATVGVQGLFDYPIYAQGYSLPKQPKPPKQNPPLPKPLKKGGKIELKGYNLDSYSSDPSQAYSGTIELRTNNDHKKSVKLREDVVINADVVVGPGGDPDKVIEMKDGAVVTGDAYAATEREELLSIPVPSELESLPAIEYEWHGGPGGSIAITGNVKYSSFIIPKPHKQDIVGDVMIYVTGDMKVEDMAELTLTAGSSLKIYVNGKLEVKKKSKGLINETQDPTKLMIFGTDDCRKVKIENVDAGDFYGAVYAPYAKVEMKTDGDLYGAFVGWDVKLKKKKGEAHGTFYFDRSLRTGNVNASDDGAVRFTVKDWHEI